MLVCLTSTFASLSSKTRAYMKASVKISNKQEMFRKHIQDGADCCCWLVSEREVWWMKEVCWWVKEVCWCCCWNILTASSRAGLPARRAVKKLSRSCKILDISSLDFLALSMLPLRLLVLVAKRLLLLLVGGAWWSGRKGIVLTPMEPIGGDGEGSSAQHLVSLH